MEFVLLVVLLLLSAVFSGTETAYFSLGETERAGLESRPGGPRVLALLRDPTRLLSALLIGNLLVNTVASVVATSVAVARFGSNGVALAVPLVTLALLMAGEITPKLVALRNPATVALRLRRPLAFWVGITRPVLALIAAGTAFLLNRLPGDRSGSRPLTAEELADAAALAVDQAVLTETEGRFLSRLLVMDTLDVREIMTPRPAVAALDPAMDRAAVLDLARHAGFNRYPVMGPDDVRPRGMLHLKDLLDPGRAARTLASPGRPVFVPETKSVAELLREMKAGTSHMAFVVDEHGDYVGLVTLEDCLEALTGPWADESDDDTADILPVADGNWVVDGLVDLRRLNEVIGSRLATRRDTVTLGGLVMAGLGRIPQRGERLVEDGYRFTVLEMEGRRVARVRVQRLDATAEGRGER
ncbi:MAG TPA: hemolysin family protein [Candidatus Krumholzibacteria bacterium]|nr:hemolysin family protein [Candidatus Krumholzibacteria bacterium]HRX50225.1 hemolysin family protein [Candidatus Krumholzibacteria bacterium]